MRKEDLKNPCFACITNTSDPEKKYKELTIAQCMLIDEICAIENFEKLLMSGEPIPQKMVVATLEGNGDIKIKYDMRLPKLPLEAGGNAYYRTLRQTWVSETQRTLYVLANTADISAIRHREPGERWLVSIKEIVPEGFRSRLDVDNYIIKFIIDGIRYSGILGNVDDHFGNFGYAVTGHYGPDFGVEVTIKKTTKYIVVGI